MTTTATSIVTIANRLGLHARPAMLLAEAAMEYESEVTVRRLDQTDVVDAKSIMQLMMLAAVCGTRLELTATGSDSNSAVAALRSLIESNFSEDLLDGSS